MRGIDSSVLFTFLRNDPPIEAAKCEALFRRVAEREEKVYVPFVVVYQLATELEKTPGLAKDEIITLLRDLLAMRGVTFGSRNFLKLVFDVYQSTELTFEEATLVAAIQKRGLTSVYSYNEESLKKNLDVVEP